MRWSDIPPDKATDINLSVRLDITAPHNENGDRCPWPWEPQQLVDVPMGQYHCPYCGAMCVAGMPHPDYGARSPGYDHEHPCPTSAGCITALRKIGHDVPDGTDCCVCWLEGEAER